MLNSEIGKLNWEVELHKTQATNSKEKLNLAVTKGKSLVQQRDSLKEVIVEKTNGLSKCLIELQEKSTALEAAISLNIKPFCKGMWYLKIVKKFCHLVVIENNFSHPLLLITSRGLQMDLSSYMMKLIE
ncbi:hypothetical protein Tco_0402902 [Tanacetum coccineum]